MTKKIIYISLATILISFMYLNWFSPIKKTVHFYEVDFTIDGASQAADTIIIGKINKVNDARWNGKDGEKPHKESPNMKLIFKPTIVEIKEFLKGEETKQKIEIINPGGTVGRETLDLEGLPSFKEGQEVVLFLLKNKDPGDGIKRYDVIWSYLIDKETANNMRKKESLPLNELKNQIVESIKLTKTKN